MATEADLTLTLSRENAELRELLTLVAQELERLAAHHPELARGLLARARRLRARLHAL